LYRGGFIVVGSVDPFQQSFVKSEFCKLQSSNCILM
jgi:hypothetical protein